MVVYREGYETVAIGRGVNPVLLSAVGFILKKGVGVGADIADAGEALSHVEEG